MSYLIIQGSGGQIRAATFLLFATLCFFAYSDHLLALAALVIEFVRAYGMGILKLIAVWWALKTIGTLLTAARIIIANHKLVEPTV